MARKKEVTKVAVYVDADNFGHDFSLEKLMISLLSGEDDCVFAVKSAYGNAKSVKSSLAKQLLEHNFVQFNTPNVGHEKNRADLMISLDAFETLYINNPDIDRYCFLTSDSDFTVIGDKLRKYGKEVWLVCKTADRNRAILSKSFDKLLFVEDFQDGMKTFDDDPLATLFIRALGLLDKNKLPLNVSRANDMMRRIDPSFSISKTSYSNFMSFAKQMENLGLVKLHCPPSGDNRIVDILV